MWSLKQVSTELSGTEILDSNAAPSTVIKSPFK